MSLAAWQYRKNSSCGIKQDRSNKQTGNKQTGEQKDPREIDRAQSISPLHTPSPPPITQYHSAGQYRGMEWNAHMSLDIPARISPSRTHGQSADASFQKDVLCLCFVFCVGCCVICVLHSDHSPPPLRNDSTSSSTFILPPDTITSGLPRPTMEPNPLRPPPPGRHPP